LSKLLSGHVPDGLFEDGRANLLTCEFWLQHYKWMPQKCQPLTFQKKQVLL